MVQILASSLEKRMHAESRKVTKKAYLTVSQNESREQHQAL